MYIFFSIHKGGSWVYKRIKQIRKQRGIVNHNNKNQD